MSKSIEITDLDKIKQVVGNIVSDSKNLPDTSYIDIRVEAGEGIGSYSEDGEPKSTSKDWNFSLGVRVIAGKQILAAGYYGKQLGAADLKKFSITAREAIAIAHERAAANAFYKNGFVKNWGDFGHTVNPTNLAPIEIHNQTIAAEYEIDPRSITPENITDYACDCARVAKNHHPNIKRVELVVNTGISRQIFASSEGSLIDQSFASSGGTVFVVAADDQGGKPVDLYHHTGNQLGFEALIQGKNSHEKNFAQFAEQIAEEALQLSRAKPAPATDKQVVVVLDPDLLALFAHEIIGHPSELDRALKMEAGYAGRSWFLQDLNHTMVGKQVGSKILTAFSDPTLKGGYGHYLYDDEGTPAKRVYHIKNGIYRDFMNSRQTAGIIGAKPNGHYKANDASVIPVIRMSVSAIAPGDQDPQKIISEVEHGYYCVGHRIPSISESRENFQIAPRLIYEIKNGQIGEVFRDGRVTADSKDFFLSIDALGKDFKIFAIPNCGKGQPMQAKQVGNGGPTARGRARIARGE